MNTTNCTCQSLFATAQVANPVTADSGRPRQEFPEAFLNLALPSQILLDFYRHSERRLLQCCFCGQWFLYQSTTEGGLITEQLSPLDDSGRLEELGRLEGWARDLAAQWPEHFAHRLPALLAECQAWRAVKQA